MGRKPYKYYAVTKGRKVGVFNNWLLVKSYVDGVENNGYKGYYTEAEAEKQYQAALDEGHIEIVAEDGTRTKVRPTSPPVPSSVQTSPAMSQEGRSSVRASSKSASSGSGSRPKTQKVESTSVRLEASQRVSGSSSPRTTSSRASTTSFTTVRPSGSSSQSRLASLSDSSSSDESSGYATPASKSTAGSNTPRRLHASCSSSSTRSHRSRYSAPTFKVELGDPQDISDYPTDIEEESSSPPTGVTQYEELSPLVSNVGRLKLHGTPKSPCSDKAHKVTPIGRSKARNSSESNEASSTRLNNGLSSLAGGSLLFGPSPVPNNASDPRSPLTGSRSLPMSSTPFARPSPSRTTKSEPLSPKGSIFR